MGNYFAGMVMGFREGLEAFLVIAIIFRYISKTKQFSLKKYIWWGVGIGLAISVIFGGLLSILGNAIQNTGSVAKLWESAASIIALVLVTTFIIWMIKHGKDMTKTVESSVSKNLSKAGIITISAIMIAREGAEIAIFSFAGKYALEPVFTGVAVALVIAVLIFFSLIKANIRTIFNITLIYLILQAGFLLGYAIHEGLSAMKDLGMLSENSILLTKAFNLSSTVLNHKEGIVGIPLYVLFGWYSKPEWIQFILQYGYTIAVFGIWHTVSKRTNNEYGKHNRN